MSRKLKTKNHCLLVLCLALLCLCARSVIAVEAVNPIYSIRIDEATIKKGYEIKGFDGDFQVAVFPFVLKSPTRIELKNRTEIARAEDSGILAVAGNEDSADVINEDVINSDAINRVSTTTVDIIASSTNELDFDTNGINTPPACAGRLTPLPAMSGTGKRGTPLIGENPDGWQIDSDIYEFDVRDKNAFDGKKPFIVSIKYDDNGLENKTENRKKIFYYDGVKKEWVSLPSTIMPEDKLVRAIVQLPYAKLAIFESDKVLSIGSASWYKYKGCNCVASPDYAKGTKLKVTNLYNDKSIIVEVNDYGPDRNIFSERVVDLDIEAFTKIAKKGAGVIDVKVEPLDEICSYAFEKAKHPETPAPEINAPLAIVIDEPTGEVLYKKGEDKKVPIASISKLMTASVFLGMQHTLNPSQKGNNTPLPPLKGGINSSLLEECKGGVGWDKIITYDKADDLEGAKLYVNEGETMTIKDIFYSMLVGSANNAAKTLTKNSGVNYNDFIAEMNKKAKEWHLENTVFKDPTGLNIGNVSTALDVANMARQALKDFEMLKATTIPEYSFKTINTNKLHIIKNTDNLLLDKDLYVTGAKTGFLNEAGYCLVLKAKNKNDGREVIAVALGENTSEDRFEDVKKIVQWGLGE